MRQTFTPSHTATSNQSCATPTPIHTFPFACSRLRDVTHSCARSGLGPPGRLSGSPRPPLFAAKHRAKERSTLTVNNNRPPAARSLFCRLRLPDKLVRFLHRLRCRG